MRKRGLSLVAPAALAMVLLTIPSSAKAEIAPQVWELEFYAGSYSAGPDIFDDDIAFGGRMGYNINERFSIGGALEVSSNEADLPSGFDGNVDLDAVHIDIQFGINLFPEKRINVIFTGGPGWSFSSLDGEVEGPGEAEDAFEQLDDDSLTLNGGVGVKLKLGERMHLKLMEQIRWFESRDDDETDNILSLAFGWELGS